MLHPWNDVKPISLNCAQITRLSKYKDPPPSYSPGGGKYATHMDTMENHLIQAKFDDKHNRDGNNMWFSGINYNLINPEIDE